MIRNRQHYRHSRRVEAIVLLLVVAFAAFWMNTRRRATADQRQSRLATSVNTAAAVQVVLCAICGKPISGPVIVRRYEDGATDRIHPACYKPAKSDPPVKIAK